MRGAYFASSNGGEANNEANLAEVRCFSFLARATTIQTQML